MEFTLVVSKNCEVCERVRHQLSKIQLSNPQIETNIVRRENYKRRQVIITPALFIDNELYSYGDIDEDKLYSLLNN